ncbi:MAG: hypothetical protein HY438_03120 [DPANN group archaeon]|nr:hypothetical protein [DPANN group archaeon]
MKLGEPARFPRFREVVKMDKTNLVLIVVAVVLVLFAGAQAVQLAELRAGGGAGAASASSGTLDMSGWTADEKMMYEHHGTLPARLQKQSVAPASGGMVGGC